MTAPCGQHAAALSPACSLPTDFGDGWMSRPARDMLRVALIAGFDGKGLLRRLAFTGHGVQERTVLRIMADLDREARAEGRAS